MISPANSAKTPSVTSLSSDRLRGWKRILPIARVAVAGRARLRLRWTECAVWALGVALCGWLGAAGTAWGIVRFKRGIAQARFIDVAFPPRWPEFRRAIGDHAIARGETLLAENKAREAIFHFRSGVARSPANVRGRLRLSALFDRIGRPDLARETLLAGLPQCAHDPEFLQVLFRVLLQQQADEQVLSTAREMLARTDLAGPARAIAAEAAATVSYLHGHYDRAESFLREARLDQTPQGRLLLAKITWDRGYRELAVVELQSLVERHPNHTAAKRELRQFFQTLGRNEEFRRLCLSEHLANPNNAAVRVDLLLAYQQSAPDRLPSEIDGMLRDFANDEDALVALAAFGANIGDSALTQRVLDHCVAHGLSRHAPAFLHVESLIVAREHRRALEVTRELFASHDSWPKHHQSLFNSLQAIAHFGLGDVATAELYLQNFLQLPGLRADSLLRVAQRFEELGGTAQAHRTLDHAAAVDPLNQAVLTRLIELEIQLRKIDTLPDHLARFVTTRRPKPAVLGAARELISGDTFADSPHRASLLAALDKALAGPTLESGPAQNP